MFEPGTKINPRNSAKATPVLTQDQRIEAKPSPEDEWASLWDETRKAKGKLKVSGGHRVGWLHDMIQTTPFVILELPQNVDWTPFSAFKKVRME